MTVTVIDGVRLHGTRKAIIPATTSAVVTDAIEIRDLVNYTFTCTTLGTGEEILVEIYDFSLPAPNWQPYMLGGNRVKLAKDFEQIQISASSIVVRFLKSATDSNVGLTQSYR